MQDARFACMRALQSPLVRPVFPVLLAISLSDCRAVGGIFKAGVWIGIVIAVAIVAIVAGLFSVRRGGPSVRQP